ncbi:MAG: hypothetical protein ACR2J7_00630 [Luteimonas sp.]
MALTLGLTGMDQTTEAALKTAFADASEHLGGQWQLAPEGEADHIVVDMDSMYGPMSWLRLQAAGKHVIGLTSAQRTQTDFRLGRPFDTAQMEQLLRDIAQHEGVELARRDSPGDATDRIEAVDAEAEATSIAADQASTRPVPTPAAGQADPREEAEPADASAQRAPPATHLSPAPAPQDLLPKEALGAQAAPVAHAVEPAPVIPEPAPRDPMLADWLVPGALIRRVRYRRASGPALLIDPVAQTWHGASALKPIATYFAGKVDADDFEAVDDADWATESAALGIPQPLARLRWLGGLVAGQGALMAGQDPDGRYRLVKWPQTEREYPKHFRIATAMMKGPATVVEIAEASGMPAADVADFINANLATGYAEYVPEPVPEPEEPAKPAGLFGRLRNR